MLPLLLVIVAVAEAAGRGQQAAAYPRGAAAADQEGARLLPPRWRGGGDVGGGGSRQGGGGGQGGRGRHQVPVRPERGDQGREGAAQGVPEGGEGGGADAPGVAGGGYRRRLGQVPAGRRLRQGVHQGVPGRLERPAGRRQRGVLCCAGEGHQIIGGVLLQGWTFRLASRRCQNQDPRRPQRRGGQSLDLFAWPQLHCICVPMNVLGVVPSDITELRTLSIRCVPDKSPTCHSVLFSKLYDTYEFRLCFPFSQNITISKVGTLHKAFHSFQISHRDKDDQWERPRWSTIAQRMQHPERLAFYHNAEIANS